MKNNINIKNKESEWLVNVSKIGDNIRFVTLKLSIMLEIVDVYEYMLSSSDESSIFSLLDNCVNVLVDSENLIDGSLLYGYKRIFDWDKHNMKQYEYYCLAAQSGCVLIVDTDFTKTKIMKAETIKSELNIQKYEMAYSEYRKVLDRHKEKIKLAFEEKLKHAERDIRSSVILVDEVINNEQKRNVYVKFGPTSEEIQFDDYDDIYMYFDPALSTISLPDIMRKRIETIIYTACINQKARCNIYMREAGIFSEEVMDLKVRIIKYGGGNKLANNVVLELNTKVNTILAENNEDVIVMYSRENKMSSIIQKLRKDGWIIRSVIFGLDTTTYEIYKSIKMLGDHLECGIGIGDISIVANSKVKDEAKGKKKLTVMDGNGNISILKKLGFEVVVCSDELQARDELMRHNTEQMSLYKKMAVVGGLSIPVNTALHSDRAAAYGIVTKLRKPVKISISNNSKFGAVIANTEKFMCNLSDYKSKIKLIAHDFKGEELEFINLMGIRHGYIDIGEYVNSGSIKLNTNFIHNTVGTISYKETEMNLIGYSGHTCMVIGYKGECRYIGINDGYIGDIVDELRSTLGAISKDCEYRSLMNNIIEGDSIPLDWVYSIKKIKNRTYQFFDETDYEDCSTIGGVPLRYISENYNSMAKQFRSQSVVISTKRTDGTQHIDATINSYVYLKSLTNSKIYCFKIHKKGMLLVKIGDNTLLDRKKYIVGNEIASTYGYELYEKLKSTPKLDMRLAAEIVTTGTFHGLLNNCRVKG